MTKTTVNLKSLFHWRTAWWWLITAGMAPLALKPLWSHLDSDDNFMGYLLISLFAVLVPASLQHEILTKPFSFCLPGHRNIPGRLVISYAGILNVLLALQFLCFPHLDWFNRIWVMIAAAFLGMVMSLLTACAIIGRGKYMVFVCILPVIFLGNAFFDMHIWPQRVLVSSPLIVIALGLFICGLLVWRWPHLRDSIARQNCGRYELGILDVWDRDKLQGYYRANAARGWARRPQPVSDGTAVAGYLLARMESHACLSLGRTLWAELYAFFGWLSARDLWRCLTLCIPLVLFLGYSFRRDVDTSLMLLIAMAMLPMGFAMIYKMPAHCTLLLPVGRKEKYYGSLLAALVMTILATVIVLLVITISHLLNLFLPTVAVGSITLTYRSIPIGILHLCPLLMPLCFLLRILFPQRGMLLLSAYLSMTVFLILGVREGWLDLARPSVIVPALSASWFGFIAVLRWHCLRRTLVGPGR